MRFRHSLRFRAAVAFAAFGAFVSLLLSTAVFFAARDIELRLLSETLAVEMEDFMARRARRPAALPPATRAIRTFVDSPQGEASVPVAWSALEPGFHQLLLQGRGYYAAVAQQGSDRVYLLYDKAQLNRREQWLFAFLVVGVLAMSALSAAGGLWLAARIITPVSELARRIRHLRIGETVQPMAVDFSGDEVGELARLFDRYMERLHAFVERERAFTADLSHELRTPLAVIEGASEISLDDPQLKGRRRQRAERIARAARQMSELTQALLVLAREDTDDRPVPATNVGNVLEDVVEGHRHLLAAEGVQLTVDLAANPNLLVPPAVLQIVLGNLVRNAFCYTKRGSILIRLEADRAILEDTGPGIAPEELPRIFERHFHGTQNPRGTGIGLALAKRVCERQGWQIIVQSHPGQGTRMELVFRSAPQTEPVSAG
ncbi:MAG: HAMP domain-containing sensor histidine kinase [Gammaproteobacteria bacterium]|jgi:signal transduction histidine kinase